MNKMIALKIVELKDGSFVEFDDLTQTGKEQIRYEATNLLKKLEG
jgi:hypothetical protein